MRFSLLSLFVLVAFTCTGQSPDHTVYFHFSSAVLDSQQSHALQDFVENLSPDQTLILQGHTDDVGSQAYNLNLSQQRSKAVQDWFMNQGLGVVEATHLGEGAPVTSNLKAGGRKLNRRVDVFVVASDQSEVETPGLDDAAAMALLMHNLLPNPQHFCYTPTSDTVFVCQGGSMIYFPANAFHGVHNGECIQIEVVEAVKRSEMILAGLSTQSNGMPLESAGMLHLKASYKGSEL